MTLSGRNVTIRTLFAFSFILGATLVYLFVWTRRSGAVTVVPEIRFVHLLALAGMAVSVLLGYLFLLLYMRLFRRSPSIPVFFISFFFLSMTLDISKLGQILLDAGPWPQFSPAVARVSLFGHITGGLALFAAGLYAGGVRMQRHGTVIFAGILIALSLSSLIPVDTTYLPDHLVYPAGIRRSFGSALIVLLVMAVLNFVQAAVANRNPRILFTAGAVASLAAGRELLFYLVDPLWILLGAGLIILGAAVFTGQHYRDFLVS